VCCPVRLSNNPLETDLRKRASLACLAAQWAADPPTRKPAAWATIDHGGV